MIIPQTLQNVLSRLHGVRQLSNGSWMAQCPAHGDKEPSLHVSLQSEKVLLHCFAGCSFEAICRALNIEPKKLFPHEEPGGNHHLEGEGLTLEAFAKAKALETELLRQAQVTQGVYQGKPAVLFKYRDTEGDLQAIRYRVALEGDRFRWQKGAEPRKLAYGEWWLPYWREKGKRVVVLVEGETDALTLWQAGIPALGIAGANNLSEHHAKLLEGFEVVVWQEPDSGGITFAQKASELFSNVKVIQPPDGLKDASELWLKCVTEHGEQAKAVFRDQVRQLLAQAKPVEPETTTDDVTPIIYAVTSSVREPLDLGTIPEPPPIAWLVDGIIPSRFITNLYADSGQGKSYLTLYLALCCLTGTPFAGKAVAMGKVLYLDWELDAETTARRWYAICRGAGFPSALGGLLYCRMANPITGDFSTIRELVCKHKPVLLIIDSLGKALGEDPLDPKVAIKAYTELDTLRTAVLIVDHQPKSAGDGVYASLREYGTAYKGHLARSRLQLERVGEAKLADGTTQVGVVLRHKKNNFGSLHPDIHLLLSFESRENNLHAVRFELAQVDSSAEALGTRGEIIHLLRQQPLTADQLAEALGIARTTVSDHLQALRKAGLITECGKQGKAKVWVLKDSDDVTARIVGVTSSECQHGEPSEDTLPWWVTGEGVPEGDEPAYLEVEGDENL
jgi:DNA-binding transcriptional ArsR family regulator